MKVKTLLAVGALLSSSVMASEGMQSSLRSTELYGGYFVKGEQLVTEAVYGCNAGLFKAYVNTETTPATLMVVKSDGPDCLIVPYRQELKVKLPKVLDKKTGKLVTIGEFKLQNVFNK
ncbi:hypothetical protein [Zooshikella ganghwensis]|uniref:hypothetical protein n=1 Tax=Zooshikella ganghwensis TaxID=202772 RepID=UPI0004139332|nr:hypothetical protein [Zooshikella ganghwensis]